MERSRADVGPRHYGLEWLLENQPRWTAKEACPLTCGTLCGDDLDWTYTVEPMSCSGRNICGCDDKSFCDFKDRSKRFWDRPSISPGGSCEKCPKDIEKCEKSFRPEAGVVDCKNCCFDAGGRPRRRRVLDASPRRLDAPYRRVHRRPEGHARRRVGAAPRDDGLGHKPPDPAPSHAVARRGREPFPPS